MGNRECSVVCPVCNEELYARIFSPSCLILLLQTFALVIEAKRRATAAAQTLTHVTKAQTKTNKEENRRVKTTRDSEASTELYR